MSNIKLSTTDDVVHKKVTTLLMGRPKIGKTSLALTLNLEQDSNLLYIAADPGHLVLRKRKFQIARPQDGRPVDMEFLEDVYKYTRQEAAKGNLKWSFIDGLDVIADAVLRDKMKTQRDGRKAYGEMAEFMQEWIFKMRDLPAVSTVMITHVDEREVGGEVEYVPMLPGQILLKKIFGWFDEIGAYRFVKTGENKIERYIQFSSEVDPAYMVGDRSGVLSPFELPDLQKIFDKIHNEGLITEGNADEILIPRDPEDLKALQALAIAAKMSVQEVTALASEISGGRSPKYLKDADYETLVNKMKEKVND